MSYSELYFACCCALQRTGKFTSENKVKYEGFGGKRAVGFLLKIELCQKRSKFRMYSVVLIRCVKECSVCFLAEVCLVFEILCKPKSCILWSRKHVTAKMVISLKIKQNIDLLQCATLKSVHFR